MIQDQLPVGRKAALRASLRNVLSVTALWVLVACAVGSVIGREWDVLVYDVIGASVMLTIVLQRHGRL